MSRPSASIIAVLTCSVLGLGCAKKDPAYDKAMEEWAMKSCDCYHRPNKEAQACFQNVKEPEFPSHALDAMMTNPNHEISRQWKEFVQQCRPR